MSNISYNTIMDVTSSWDLVKKIPDYEEKIGLLTIARMFEIDSKIRTIFKVGEKDSVKGNPKLAQHARMIAFMIDYAVNILGPSMDCLKYDLMELGQRHVQFGVTQRNLSLMENAVIHALEDVLGDNFTKNNRNSWQIIFYFMTQQMIEGMD